jgi:Protein of unknown function (DUF3048) N-terminal domain/Protein of unknown function (DUF3048) C-terminal domain
MTRTSRSTRAVLATSVVVGLLATACTGSDKKSTPSDSASSTAPSSTAATSSSAKPAVKPPKPLAVNPFTGIGGVPKYPTVAVKMDDTAPGRPQVGIDKADIVYIEEVEGGLTRLAAIFGTHHPTSAGYVRSTRPSDPDLLLQYGKITEVYSGGAHDSLPRVRDSGITSWSNDAGAAYYARVSRSESSYINLVINVNKVSKTVKTPRPKDIGLRFSSTPPGKGKPGTDVRTQVGGTPVEFRWYPKMKRYVRYIDGVAQKAADGKLIATANVIVQTCTIVPHPQDTDVLGNPSQFTVTKGKGKVIVFRNGRMFTGTWSRPKMPSGTTLKWGKKSLTLARGGEWFALVRSSAHTTGS